MFKELKIEVRSYQEHKLTPTYAFKYKDSDFFVVSHEKTRHLLLTPEKVGLDLPYALKAPTSKILNHLKENGVINSVNILNILRGGLNFPIAECCYENNINVVAESFLSSERIFLDETVSRLETQYNKIVPVHNCSVVLGDIVASGNTLQNAVNYLLESYIKADMRPRNLIFFTVGTLSTLEAISTINIKLKKRWSDFDGIITIFYEGVFNNYKNAGVTGLNLANVDFVYNGSFLTPEFRECLINSLTPLFEKCIIYDGGARRFEKSAHINSILGYWHLLSERAKSLALSELLVEKYGNSFRCTFTDWLNELNYTSLSDIDMLSKLHSREIEWANMLAQGNLSKLCQNRYEELQNYYDLRRD